MTQEIVDDKVDEKIDESPVEPGDHDTFSHYIKRSDLDRAMLDGKPVLAICGKFWVPTKDHTKYLVCPSCKEVWEKMKDGPVE